MPSKRSGKSPYRRVANQKPALAPTRTPGNHPTVIEDPETPAKIDRLIIPGQQPVSKRVIERRIQHESFNGPIPHPDIFRQYGEVIPDAPERILKVFEADSAHIREMQRGALAAQSQENRRIQWMAFCLIAGGYAIGLTFAAFGKDTLAGIVLGSTMIATLVGFLQNNREQSRATTETENKKLQNAPENVPRSEDE